MATLEHCLGLYSLDKEDAAELGAFVSSEGDPVKGLQKYLATLDREMSDLESAVREAGPDLESQAEGFSEDEAGRQDLGRLVAEGADREVLDNHPVVLKAIADMEAKPETWLDEIYSSDEWHAGREYIFGSDTVQGTAAALDRWVNKAESYAGGEVNREKRLTLVLGPPAAGKSTIAEDLARTKGAAIVDADDIKKTLPEYDGGIGASATHEESSDLADILEDALRADEANIVYPKVGGDPAKIREMIARFKADGYEVELVNMAVTAENAYKRMIGRFVDEGRLIKPSYVDEVGELPTETFKTLKEEGQADGYAQIDNNVGKDDPKPISEIEGRNPLEGSSYDLQRGGEKGIQPVSGSTKDIEGAQESLARLEAAQVRFQGLDADRQVKDFEAYVAASTELSDARRAAADDLARSGQGAKLENRKGNLTALVTPRTDGRPGARITYMDAAGPSGDTMHDSLKAAYRDAFDQGYDVLKDQRAGAKSEVTSAGEQTLMPGVEPITERARLEAAQAQPMSAQSRASDTEIGGMFDPMDPKRAVDDLFDQVPIGVRKDADGLDMADTINAQDLAADLDADDEFVEQLGLCLKG